MYKFHIIYKLISKDYEHFDGLTKPELLICKLDLATQTHKEKGQVRSKGKRKGKALIQGRKEEQDLEKDGSFKEIEELQHIFMGEE